MKRAVVPGTFDPITAGHVDVIKRASQIFDDVVVAVAQSVKKNPMFDLETRVSLATQAVADLPNVSVISFDGLLVDCVRDLDAHVVVKGLRAITDFEYEFQMALTNKKLNPQFETLFLPTSIEHMFLSSSMVKQIAGFGGDISHFVPECLLEKINQRLCRTAD